MLRHLARLLLIMGPLGCPCDPCEKAAFFFVQDEMICVTMTKLMNIKRNFIVLLTIAGTFGSIASGLAQTKDSSPAAAPGEKKESAAPKIQFAEMVYDFGKVTSGELVKHTFVFTNIGTATLEIKDVRPGCGCTTAGTWDKEVEPGKTGSIPLQFNSANFGGTVMKQATVTCNDPSQSNVVLQIKGTVWKAIEIAPSMAVFNVSSEAQTNDTKIVRIVSNLEEPLVLSDLQCTNHSFKAELKTVRPGKEFELHITALPPFTSPSMVAPVTIKTSSTNMPLINVSAYVAVQQPVTDQSVTKTDTDLERAKAALLEIEQRLAQNNFPQQIAATVAKRHRDHGVDMLYDLIMQDSAAVGSDRRGQRIARQRAATMKTRSR